MTCQDARDLFSPLVDGAVPPPEEAGLRAHVAGCADCARELASFERLVGLLRAVEPARAPAGFVDRVVAAARTTPWYRRLLRGLFVPLPAKLPLEAAAIVLVGVMVAAVYRQTPELQQAAREGSPSLAASRDPGATRAETPTETPTTSAESRSSGDAPARVSELRAPSAAPAPETREAGPQHRDEARRYATPPERDASRVLSTTFQKALKDRSAKESPAAPGALPGAAPPPSSPAPSGAVTTPGAPATPGAATTPGDATAPDTAAPQGTVGASRGARSATREMADARREAQATPSTAPPGPARDAAQPEVAKRAAPEPRPAAPTSVGSAARSSAERSRAAPDVVGRLSVTDRAAARRAVSEMASKLGGTEVVRSAGADESPVVEILIPRRAWEDLVRELSRLGRWTIESRPAELPPDVQVAIRLD